MYSSKKLKSLSRYFIYLAFLGIFLGLNSVVDFFSSERDFKKLFEYVNFIEFLSDNKLISTGLFFLIISPIPLVVNKIYLHKHFK